MLLQTNKDSKNFRGQAMAEFALTIPVFLLLIFGVIELSRYFLVYSSIFTATREATRYGSSVGDESLPNYQNCEMIAETAVRMGNFGGVQSDDISIYYESEPGTWVADCDPAVENSKRYKPKLGDRIVVEISTDFDSMLDIVPDMTVNASNGRTIMLGVLKQGSVIVTEDPDDESTPVPTQAPTEAPTEAPTDAPTEVPTEAPTETPTEEPTKTPTDVIVCPTGNIAISSVNTGQQTITFNLKNNTGVDYKINYFDQIQWTRFYVKNKSQTYDRKLNGLFIRSSNQISINYEPPTGKIYPNQSSSLIGKTETALPVMFSFSDKIDGLGLSFIINFSKPDGTCSKTLNYP